MKELKEYLFHLNNILSVSGDEIIIIEPSGKIVYCNDLFLLDIQADRKEISKLNLSSIIGEPTLQTIQKGVKKNIFFHIAVDFIVRNQIHNRSVYAFNIKPFETIIGTVLIIPEPRNEEISLKHDLFQFSLLKAMNTRNDTMYFITDFQKAKNIFTSESLKSLFGYDPAFINFGGWVFYLTLVHPNDLENLLLKHSEWIIMKNKLGLLYEHIEYSNTYRMKNSSGEFVSVETQSNVLEWDEDGKIKLLLGSLRKIDDQKREEKLSLLDESPVKFIDGKTYVEINYLKNLQVEKSSLNFKKTFQALTSRETETMELIIDELTSEEISHKLNISIHTVNLHRKNILKKLGVKNIAGLMKMYYQSK